jgi:hypothetical protein
MLELGDPELPERLHALVEPLARGDPESPLRWTSKSTRGLAAELTAGGHPISHETVAQLLLHMNYSLQGNRKTEEGTEHPDRDAQFRLSTTRSARLRSGRSFRSTPRRRNCSATARTRGVGGKRRRRSST